HSGGRSDRLCDEGRRGAHPGSRLRGLFVEADPCAPVHGNHPPLSRSRPEHSGPLAAARNSQLVVAPSSAMSSPAARKRGRPLMLSYDQAAAKMQWREAVRAVTEAIEDAGGVVNNVNDAKLDAVEAWIGESRRWLLDGLRLGRIDVAKANRAMCAADK